MKKTKVKILLILFLLITFISTLSSASYNNVMMSVVDEPIVTIKIGDNSKVERKLISKDLNNKELTLQLQVSNNEKDLKPTGEVMLLIDNSKSMLDTVSDSTTREDLVITSAKTLITNLLKDNSDLKIGAVSFSTNSDIQKEGTLEDAKLVSELTNNSESLISSISNIQYDGPRTDLDAGISLAKKYFTSNTDKTHKYLIVLSDGVPNVAVDYDKNYYSDDVISKTKANLTSLSEITDNVIVMLTGISNGDVLATGLQKTYNQIISEVFGTTEKPTIGKFYYITDKDIETTITQKIYNDLLPVSVSIKNIKVTDYFPNEIIKNFDFSYVTKPNIGTISETIDSNNSIIWNIKELKSTEVATVQYKLKLKEKYDESIVDKVLNTNTKLDLNYTSTSNENITQTSDVSPKLKLQEPTVIPKAGKTIFFTFIGITFTLLIISGIKFFTIKNRMK